LFQLSGVLFLFLLLNRLTCPLLCLENFTFVSYGISVCFHMFLCAKFDVMILLHWLCWLTSLSTIVQ
jgi:hypothetical protein